MNHSWLTTIRAVSFDCYGTLIDWQSGIESAIAPLRQGMPQLPAGESLFREFANLERESEQPPYRSYKDVLREVMAGLSGIAGPCELHDTLWRSISQWPAFKDAPESLRRLRAKFGRLTVLSNIDDELFGFSHARIGTVVDLAITAQQVRSYKPAEANFRALLKALDLEPHQVLHVAESRYHDIEPASRLGFRTAWIERQRGSSASGEPTRADARPDLHTRTLRELCDVVGA